MDLTNLINSEWFILAIVLLVIFVAMIWRWGKSARLKKKQKEYQEEVPQPDITPRIIGPAQRQSSFSFGVPTTLAAAANMTANILNAKIAALDEGITMSKEVVIGKLQEINAIKHEVDALLQVIKEPYDRLYRMEYVMTGMYKRL